MESNADDDKAPPRKRSSKKQRRAARADEATESKNDPATPKRLIERKKAVAVVAHAAADFILRFGGFESKTGKTPSRAQLDGLVSLAVRLVYRLEEPSRELAKYTIQLGHMCQCSANGSLRWYGHRAKPAATAESKVTEAPNAKSPVPKQVLPSGVDDLGALKLDDVDTDLLGFMSAFAHSKSVSSSVANAAAIAVALLAYKIVTDAKTSVPGIAKNLFEATAKVERLSDEARGICVLVEQKLMFGDEAAEREVIEAVSKLLIGIRLKAKLTSKDLYRPLPRGTDVPTRPRGSDAFDDLLRSYGVGTARAKPKVEATSEPKRTPDRPTSDSASRADNHTHRFSHSSDFSSVVFDGVRHKFTKLQARCVAMLWTEWEKGPHGLKQETIGEDSGSEANRFRLRDVFREKNGKMHEAWGTMIVDMGKGVFGLKPRPPQ